MRLSPFLVWKSSNPPFCTPPSLSPWGFPTFELAGTLGKTKGKRSSSIALAHSSRNGRWWREGPGMHCRAPLVARTCTLNSPQAHGELTGCLLLSWPERLRHLQWVENLQQIHWHDDLVHNHARSLRPYHRRRQLVELANPNCEMRDIQFVKMQTYFHLLRVWVAIMKVENGITIVIVISTIARFINHLLCPEHCYKYSTFISSSVFSVTLRNRYYRQTPFSAKKNEAETRKKVLEPTKTSVNRTCMNLCLFLPRY